MNHTYQFEKIETKISTSTLKVNGFLLHSKYNPIKESEQFASANLKENHIHILFGYGLGYIADALQKKMYNTEALVIVDPIIDEIKDMSEFDLEKFNVVSLKFLNDEIIKRLKNTQVKVKVLCSPNYDMIFPEEYKEVLGIVKDIIDINRLERNTIELFAKSWQENYLRNLIHVSKNESLSDLKNMFSAPVVVASGGPSLDKQIPQLKEIRDQVILIASGSTINTLLHYEIEPDFIVSIDGGEANYHHFEHTTFNKAHLIFSIKNHYKIQNQFRSTSFSFVPSLESDVAKHVRRLTGKELPMLFGGTSVAIYALQIAIYISSGNIALIGQDLAYTENKTHSNFNKNYKKVDEDFKKNRKTFLVEGYYEENVLTDTAFLSMKKGFEQIYEVSEASNRLFNCTEGGSKINGYKQIPFNEFCNQIKVSEVNITIDNESFFDINMFKSKVQAEVNLYEHLVKQLKRGIKLLTSNSSDEVFDTKVVQGLSHVDKKIKSLFDKVSMNSIVNPITIDTLNDYLPIKGETTQQMFKRIYNQNSQLYTRLLEATILSKQYTIDLLNQVNEMMEG